MTNTDSTLVVSPTAQKKSTAFTVGLAVLDAVFAVIANQFFDHGTTWAVVVVAVGAILVVLTVLNVRAENGERIRAWMLIRKIVTARIFIALIAAAVAASVTFVFMDRGSKGAEAKGETPVGRTSGSPPASPRVSPSPSAQVACGLKPNGSWTVKVKPQASAPSGLTFCPALLNNGSPITAPFIATGTIIGPVAEYRDMIIVNRADADTCDAFGNPAVNGYFYARGMTIDADGTWAFRDGLGYAEAVTLGRVYSFVSGPTAAIDAIKNDREIYKKKHGGNDDDYAGMPNLPAAARIVATFHQAPGTFQGKVVPCKNS